MGVATDFPFPFNEAEEAVGLTGVAEEDEEETWLWLVVDDMVEE